MSDPLDNGLEPHVDSHELARAENTMAAPHTPRMPAETLQAAMRVLARLTGETHRPGAGT